jgi:hypothetical protein
VLEGGVHDVDLDLHVVAEEVDRVGAVREDAPDLGCRQGDVARLGLSEVLEDAAPVREVKLG